MIGKLTLLLLVAFAASNEVLYREMVADSEGNMIIRDVPFDSSKHGSRIVGGREVDPPHKYPHMAALVMSNGGLLSWFCGGALIDPQWVLTAAHCTTDNTASIDVTLGAHDRNADVTTEPNRITVVATQYFPHEEFSQITARNDISLIKLPSPVEINEHVDVISLARSEVPDNEMVVPTGWGQEADNETGVADYLEEVIMPTMTLTECAETYTGPPVWEGVICLDGTGGVGTCSGDSGGPTHWESDPAMPGTQVTIGVTSFGHIEGCEKGHPNAITKVSYYLQWIQDTMAANP